MWKCPSCLKEFAKPNQSHKCVIADIDSLFVGKKTDLKLLYQHLLKSISVIGNFKVTNTEKAITLYAESRISFMGIIVKKNWLETWFVLNMRTDEFPVYKIIQASKTRFGHFVQLHEKKDIDDGFIRLVKQSYNYVNNKKPSMQKISK